MTRNQIAYQNYTESVRANKAREGETNRSNLANEQETKRSNLAREAETNRSNIARESEAIRSNMVNEQIKGLELQEKSRSNRANESIGRTQASAALKSANAAQDSAYANLLNADTRQYELVETSRHNTAAEAETNRANRAKELETMRYNSANIRETQRHNEATEGNTQRGQNLDTLTRIIVSQNQLTGNLYGSGASGLSRLVGSFARLVK